MLFSCGCIKNDDQISWAGAHELQMEIRLAEFNVEDNASIIFLNISLQNICDKVVYIPELLFDYTIDGVIIDSNNSSLFINNYLLCHFSWESIKHEKLYPGERKYYPDSEYIPLGFYNEQNNTFMEDRILLSSTEYYVIKCWYEYKDAKVYSNEIRFSPSEWEQ